MVKNRDSPATAAMAISLTARPARGRSGFPVPPVVSSPAATAGGGEFDPVPPMVVSSLKIFRWFQRHYDRQGPGENLY